MTRIRELGIPLEGNPGPFNAITDVEGVEVGYSTIISGEGALEIGKGPIRTGVTAILPCGKRYSPVFAAWYSLNGCGEVTGTTWIEESGFLESGIAFTSTTSVGNVHDAMSSWSMEHIRGTNPEFPYAFWFLPVVGETIDFHLNDVAGRHVRSEHVFEAFNKASGGPIAEGNVGGGTGMMSYEFKGGTGTASRKLNEEDGGYTIGVLVQANHGSRHEITVAGVPVGREINDLMPDLREISVRPTTASSILVAVATDAPLLPVQLKRLARRVPMGMARTGATGHNSSGDIFLAFSTANSQAAKRSELAQAEFLPNNSLDPLFEAVIQATEEAILNTLTAAETMTGINGNTVYALPHDRLVEVMRKYNRIV